MRRRPFALLVMTAVVATPLAASALSPRAAGLQPQPVDPTVVAARETEPVVLSGAQFPGWAVPANVTAKAPATDLVHCQSFDEKCAHNHYESPEVDSARVAHPSGTAVDKLTGWRWDAKAKQFREVPFQVDEMFVRYLDNAASGFSVYSGEDQHLAYAFNREGFRYTKSAAKNLCHAVPDSPTAKDPIAGLDTNDELVFMADDAGAVAPASAPLPKGVTDARVVSLRDPVAGLARYLYVMRGVAPHFSTANGYVHYQRDANADMFAYSKSSYSGYGNAARGVFCDEHGNLVRDPKTHKPVVERRRPRDGATITTDRYRFRYDGRWLMTDIRIKTEAAKAFGPDLVDRWKARAFAQDPGSETPCCGYEEEDTNWGGSSTLMGERWGPVRVVRETWGADSGTNVVRRETYYRREMRMKTFLRVHVIPPLDGIYAQWDFNAGRMTKFYNPQHKTGVVIDGRNDEVVGNFDDPCNRGYDSNDTSAIDQTYRSTYRTATLCERSPYHQSIDPGDPTFADPNAALGWTQTSGPWGTIVDRYSSNATDLTPGGAAQSLMAVPYYRDDACFDDGTGSDPGPKINLRSGDETNRAADGTVRRCWTPRDGLTRGSDHFYQGDIGAHGLHLLFLVDSDNGRQTVPLDEIVSEQRQVFLPGNPGNVGEKYGRAFEKPLTAAVSPTRQGI